MWRLSRAWGLVAAAVVVHLILCYSVIDIHFKSPVIPGVQPVQPDTVAPAKRLVLIVADGTAPAPLQLPVHIDIRPYIVHTCQRMLVSAATAPFVRPVLDRSSRIKFPAFQGVCSGDVAHVQACGQTIWCAIAQTRVSRLRRSCAMSAPARAATASRTRARPQSHDPGTWR